MARPPRLLNATHVDIEARVALGGFYVELPL